MDIEKYDPELAGGEERQGHTARHDGGRTDQQANRDAAQRATGHHGQANGIQHKVITNARQSAFVPVLQSLEGTGVLGQQMPEPQSELTVILQEMRRMSRQSETSLQEMSKQMLQEMCKQMLQSKNRQATSFAKQLLQLENRQAEMIKDIQEKLLISISSKVAELTVQLAKREVSEPELYCIGRDQQQAGQHSVKASEQAGIKSVAVMGTSASVAGSQAGKKSESQAYYSAGKPGARFPQTSETSQKLAFEEWLEKSQQSRLQRVHDELDAAGQERYRRGVNEGRCQAHITHHVAEMAYHMERLALGYNAGVTCHKERQIALSYHGSSIDQVEELCYHTGSSDESNLVQGTVEGSVSWQNSNVPSEHIGNEDESEYSCDDSADFSDYTSDGASEYSRDADSND